MRLSAASAFSRASSGTLGVVLARLGERLRDVGVDAELDQLRGAHARVVAEVPIHDLAIRGQRLPQRSSASAVVHAGR